MKLRSIREVKKLLGKRVLLRTGLDLPLQANKRIDTSDNSRIELALPTIQYLIDKKAITIIVNHFGRPCGRRVDSLTHDGVVRRLSKFLGKKVKKLDEITGPAVVKEIECSRPGDVIMLENIRFDPRENVKQSQTLAKELAQLADMYVNDAFSNSHRNHTSMVGITAYLPSYAGLLVEKEVQELSAIFEKPLRPVVAVLGGAKTETKIGLIQTFLKTADYVLVGGVLANTVLKAKGFAVGKSLVDDDMIAAVKKINLLDPKLHLPLDIAAGKSLSPNAQARYKAVGAVAAGEYIFDIGPDTIGLFTSIISCAKTIVWNGPMGLVEYKAFRKGSLQILKSILESRAKVIMGGGDSIKVLTMFAPKFVKEYPNLYVSSGGGAMLKFFEDPQLPALKPLIKK